MGTGPTRTSGSRVSVLGRERFIVYGAAAAFWVNLAAWLITRDGDHSRELTAPGMAGPLEWLALALLATIGTARAAFLIALGPNRKGEWTPVWERPQSERSAPTLASSPVDAPATDETPATREVVETQDAGAEGVHPQAAKAQGTSRETLVHGRPHGQGPKPPGR